jgi:hypothetical protein
VVCYLAPDYVYSIFKNCEKATDKTKELFEKVCRCLVLFQRVVKIKL